MKDAYSFDLDQAGARHAYNKMFVAYLRTFARLGLKSIPMRRKPARSEETSPTSSSFWPHTGETEVFAIKTISTFPVPADVDFDDVAGLQGIVDKWTRSMRRPRKA